MMDEEDILQFFISHYKAMAFFVTRIDDEEVDLLLEMKKRYAKSDNPELREAAALGAHMASWEKAHRNIMKSIREDVKAKYKERYVEDDIPGPTKTFN